MHLSYGEEHGGVRLRLALRFSADAGARVIVLAAVAIFVGFWLDRSLTSWRDMRTHAYDLAVFDQLIWNTAHGRLFETSFAPYNYLGDHFQPVLILFVPIYWLGGGAQALLGAQALVSGLAAIALYEAARALRLHPVLAASAAVTYLLNPYLHRALAFDFHPETMLALPAFAALSAFAGGRIRLGVALALSLLLFKEDAVFVTLALAGCAATLGRRRPALAVASVALLSTVLVVGWLMPHARDGYPSHLAARYTVLGGREGLSALAFMAQHPSEAVRVLAQPGRTEPGVQFVAAAPWVLLAPWQALALSPGLALTLLSSHAPQRTLDLHYAVEMVPVAALAGLFACRRLARSLPVPSVAALILLSTVLATLALSPVSPSARSGAGQGKATHVRAVEEAIALVPSDAAVSAQSNLAPRLAHRQQLWVFPGWWEEADWVLVDGEGGSDSDFRAALESVRRTYRLAYEADGAPCCFNRRATSVRDDQPVATNLIAVEARRG